MCSIYPSININLLQTCKEPEILDKTHRPVNQQHVTPPPPPRPNAPPNYRTKWENTSTRFFIAQSDRESHRVDIRDPGMQRQGLRCHGFAMTSRAEKEKSYSHEDEGDYWHMSCFENSKQKWEAPKNYSNTRSSPQIRERKGKLCLMLPRGSLVGESVETRSW